mmetsp:Transcript_120228/g.212559  ORF Transcript_120228/g.212559 Transcript_120228/m.212559 type:complete len:106 (+) Transcript_120228:275-592(+)
MDSLVAHVEEPYCDGQRTKEKTHRKTENGVICLMFVMRQKHVLGDGEHHEKKWNHHKKCEGRFATHPMIVHNSEICSYLIIGVHVAYLNDSINRTCRGHEGTKQR